MNEIVHMLQRCKLFCNLEASAIEEHILPAGNVLQCSQNTALILGQDIIDWFAVLLQGRVQIAQNHSDGRRNLMGILQPPSVIAADLICTRTRRAPYDAIAAENSRLLCFPTDWLMGHRLEQDIQISIFRQLMTLVSHDNMRKHYRIAILSQKELRSRILTYLTMQAERLGRSRFMIPFNREELADYLCVNRSALSHELKKMEREGILRTRKNLFTIYGIEDRNLSMREQSRVEQGFLFTSEKTE
ncbi:MAG: Crp/Fnr family transcriptional regulator [Stomatobaculum sp.]